MTEPKQRRGLGGFVADLVEDGGAVVGAGLITFGVWRIYEPAAFIAAGAFMFAAAWGLASKGRG